MGIPCKSLKKGSKKGNLKKMDVNLKIPRGKP